MRLSPAETVAYVFGSYAAVARELQIVRVQPGDWVKRGGLIPSAHLTPLLLAAKARGLVLTESDLIHGRDVPALKEWAPKAGGKPRRPLVEA